MITDPKESRLLAAAINTNELTADQKSEIARASLTANSIKELPTWVQDLTAKTRRDNR